MIKLVMGLKGTGKTKELISTVNSVATMRGRIDGLLCIEIGLNLAGGDYDLIFYAELRDEQALQCFQQHPLHAAHRERCKDLVTARLCGDVRVGTN